LRLPFEDHPPKNYQDFARCHASEHVLQIEPL